ncbi:MAG: LpxI family protein [Holosporales bacterium]|jgi:DUF1009 family protein
MPPNVYGLIAGSGALPALLVHNWESHNISYYILGFSEQTDPALLTGRPHHIGRLGAVGASLAAFKAAGVTHIVLAGQIRRPPLLQLAPDAAGLRLLARMGVSRGDDGLLKAVVRFLEEEGFGVVGAHEIIGGVLLPQRCLTRRQPTKAEHDGIAVGLAALRQLAPLDLGQAVVVAEGRVLAVEDIGGTDALLERAAGFDYQGQMILIKAAKPGQERRADMPALGLGTVQKAAASGFVGIAGTSGETLLLQQDEAISAANANDLFVCGVPPL